MAEAPGVSGRFSFLHALIRETLYGELTSSRRSDSISGWARLLSGHPWRAESAARGSCVPLRSGGAGRLVDKAIDYSTRAGDRAADALA